MIHNGEVLGAPLRMFRDTQVVIEALSGCTAGMIAYATDTHKLGAFDGAAWAWDDVGVLYEPVTNGDPDNPEIVFDASGDIVMTQV